MNRSSRHLKMVGEIIRAEAPTKPPTIHRRYTVAAVTSRKTTSSCGTDNAKTQQDPMTTVPKRRQRQRERQQQHQAIGQRKDKHLRLRRQATVKRQRKIRLPWGVRRYPSKPNAPTSSSSRTRTTIFCQHINIITNTSIDHEYSSVHYFQGCTTSKGDRLELIIV